jgi:hypothetical protein
MPEQVQLLLALYWQPIRAASRIIDHGRILFAICAAVVGIGAMQIAMSPALRHYVPPPHLEVEQQDASSTKAPVSERPEAVISALAMEPTAALKFLGALALGFVPAVVLIITLNRSHESFGVMLRKDYLPLLNCLLLSVAAAFIPAAIVIKLLALSGVATAAILTTVGVAHLYFLFLTACCVRTVGGSSFGIATLATGVGSTAMLAAVAAAGLVGGLRYYFLSPWLIYYAWVFFGNNARSLGNGFRSRQHLRRQLDAATINPNDADAHYQLGLIYKERRQFDEAKTRFMRAIEIDPTEADPAFQLGRIAIEEGKPGDAVTWLRKAAALNEKCGSFEVWRDLGVAYLQSSRLTEAREALDHYVSHRAYDPSGLYWRGKTLVALECLQDARQALRDCEEAVDTMPSHLRRQHVKWKRLASDELRRIEKTKLVDA